MTYLEHYLDLHKIQNTTHILFTLTKFGIAKKHNVVWLRETKHNAIQMQKQEFLWCLQIPRSDTKCNNMTPKKLKHY